MVAVGLALAGCGQSAVTRAVATTSSNLHSVRSGTLDLKMLSSLANGADPAGFEVQGPFATARGQGQLPTARLTYAQISGSSRQATTVLLTAGNGYLVDGSTSYELTETQLAPLRAGKSTRADSGLAGLNVKAWARSLTLRRHSDLDTVSGTVDPVPAMNDLLALAARLGNDASRQPPRLQGAEATEFKAAVSSALFVLVTGHRDRVLRSLKITFDLAANQSSRLRTVLGKLANVRLSVDLTLADVNRPVSLPTPSNVRPISERPKP